MRRFALLAVSLLAVALVIGCYTSKYTVGSLQQAKVDRAYVGDWTWVEGSDTNHIVIRNIDDKVYYVECRKGAFGTPDRYTGFVGKIKDAQFANLRELSDDGTVSDTYTIMRIELKDGKLNLRTLKDEFFTDKQIDSEAKQRDILEKNLDNEAMYDGEPLVAARDAL